MLTAEIAGRLRAALEAADFRYAAVADLLGEQAHAALHRNETAPAFRATAGGSPLETLVRLWLLQRPIESDAAERALPGLVPYLAAAGVLELDGDEVHAAVDIRPYADEGNDWWVASDLTPGLDGRPHRVAADHVLGVSPASVSLTQLTPRGTVSSALDLGTGCGVQSLHLAAHARRIVATDVNTRALAMTRLNASLNGIDRIDVREGSLFEPVTDETFDLVVTNPPFVISSGEGDLLTYRDSGLPGDEVVRRVVVDGASHLAPGGLLQVLANWAHVSGEPWAERLGAWVRETGCDAWIVQREVLDPASYVELWLKDAGLHPSTGGDRDAYLARYDRWLGWFERHSVEAIGFGWMNLRRAGRESPDVRIEEWPYDAEQPLGPEVESWSSRCDALARLSDEELLAQRLVLRPDVRQESTGRPGEADPEIIVLRQQRGMRRAVQVGSAEAGFLGACDGELTVGEILGALGQLLDQDVPALVAEQLPRVRSHLADGFLEPPATSSTTGEALPFFPRATL